jgi:hypothetical protein
LAARKEKSMRGSLFFSTDVPLAIGSSVCA